MSKESAGRVLIVAGSDSGGGAGIQADIKTVTMLGGFATTAITALTAQNTKGVQKVLPVGGDFVARQMVSILEDIGTDVIKIGMLGNHQNVEAVAGVLNRLENIPPIVLDPVMVAKGGEKLLEDHAIAAMKKLLFPVTFLLTPNIPEAEVLTGLKINNRKEMEKAGQKLLKSGVGAVLLKGGHLEGNQVLDLLFSKDGVEEFSSPRIKTRHTHGTGCTLASAVAAGLASGLPLKESVAKGCEYVLKAMRNAPELGKGHGPMGHNFGRDFSRH